MKRFTYRKWIVLAGAALALTGTSAHAARSADPMPSSASFGSVNLQQLLDGYTKKKEYDQQISTLDQRLKGYLQIQANSPMLTRDDQVRLGTLLAKPAQTDQDKAEISQLQQKSSQAVQEMATLSQKQPMTDSDKARFTELQKQQEAGQAALQEINSAYSDQEKQTNDADSQQLTKDFKAAISEVAKQHGLAVVFDSQVAIYTANDITDDVLKRLNK